ncbi:MAG: ISAs1 family transposase [Saprospiraceae bacterium]
MDNGNDYVIQVKRNQKKLCDGITKCIETSKRINVHVTKEINKGRFEKRTVSLYLPNKNHIDSSWKKLNRIILVESEGIRKGTAYHEVRYYISSLEENKASLFAKGIRQHWSIENHLHRVKDVVQNEDRCLIRNKRIVATLSLIKSITIGVFRTNGYNSIKLALERFKNRVAESGELIGIPSIIKNQN